MGWADCGKDARGRNIGYAFEARCDHPGCHVRIDRGLSYVCGNMHGGDGIGCGEYFCEKHRTNYVNPKDARECSVQVCDACAENLLSGGDWVEDEEEGEIVPKL
jgi:hypothetical protein